MFQWLKEISKRWLENPAMPLWSPAAYNYLGAPRSSSGVAIDRTTILGYPAVWRGVNLIANKVARLPLIVYRHNDDGGREPDYDHPAYKLLSKQPANIYTPFVFKQVMTAHALIHGNAFAYIFRDSNAKPIEMVILNPEYTGVAMNGGEMSYFTRVGTEDRKMLPENVLHIKGLGHDGLLGYSLLDIMREAFGLGLAAQRYGSVFFRNNGSPGPTIIKLPVFLKDKEARKKWREEWSKIHNGLDNAHKVGLLEGGADIVPFKIDNETAQFLQTREFEVKQIANIMGVPPHKLGADISTSYNSLESEERAYLNDSLDSWLVTWEEECEVKLLKDSQIVRDSHFIEFDRRSLESADYAARSQAIINEVNNGIRTENEGRALLNLAASGENGDRMRMPAGVVYQDMVDDMAAKMPMQPAEEPATGDPDKAEPIAIATDGAEGATEPGDERLLALTTSVVKRSLNRLEKAMASRKAPNSVRDVIEEHMEVIVDSLAPACRSANQTIPAWLDELADELDAVTREQQSKVFERVNAEQVAERLVHGKTV